MKKMRWISMVMMAIASLVMVSCEGEIEPVGSQSLDPNSPGNPTNPTNPGAPASFKAKIDGTQFTAATTQVYISGNSIVLAAINTSGASFGFLIDAAAVGTYPAKDHFLTYTPAGSEYGYIGANFEDENEDTGSITITAINTENHTISGTFHFKGYYSDTDTPMAPKQFTDGVFTNLPYTTENASADEFAAIVNGTAFEEVDNITLYLEVNGQPYVAIGGRDSEQRSITVAFKEDIAAGTYTITGDIADPVQVNYAADADDTGTKATSGTVTITEITGDHAKGTFTATVPHPSGTVNITGGTFDSDY